uniref:Uncharacterized protein n=1 Tax=Anopheles coluzzii TaxID=1518534 RepID=A0A8W7PNY5_ANOCL
MDFLYRARLVTLRQHQLLLLLLFVLGKDAGLQLAQLLLRRHRDVHLDCQLLPQQHVRVVRLVEGGLQLLQLLLGEDGPVAPLPLDVRVRIQKWVPGPEVTVAGDQPHLLVQMGGEQVRLQIVVAGRGLVRRTAVQPLRHGRQQLVVQWASSRLVCDRVLIEPEDAFDRKDGRERRSRIGRQGRPGGSGRGAAHVLVLLLVVVGGAFLLGGRAGAVQPISYTISSPLYAALCFRSVTLVWLYTMLRMFQMSWSTHSFSGGGPVSTSSALPTGSLGTSSPYPIGYGSQSDSTLRIQCFLLTVLRVDRVPKMLIALQKDVAQLGVEHLLPVRRDVHVVDVHHHLAVLLDLLHQMGADAPSPIAIVHHDRFHAEVSSAGTGDTFACPSTVTVSSISCVSTSVIGSVSVDVSKLQNRAMRDRGHSVFISRTHCSFSSGCRWIGTTRYGSFELLLRRFVPLHHVPVRFAREDKFGHAARLVTLQYRTVRPGARKAEPELGPKHVLIAQRHKDVLDVQVVQVLLRCDHLEQAAPGAGWNFRDGTQGNDLYAIVLAAGNDEARWHFRRVFERLQPLGSDALPLLVDLPVAVYGLTRTFPLPMLVQHGGGDRKSDGDRLIDQLAEIEAAGLPSVSPGS